MNPILDQKTQRNPDQKDTEEMGKEDRTISFICTTEFITTPCKASDTISKVVKRSFDNPCEWAILDVHSIQVPGHFTVGLLSMLYSSLCFTVVPVADRHTVRFVDYDLQIELNNINRLLLPSYSNVLDFLQDPSSDTLNCGIGMLIKVDETILLWNKKRLHMTEFANAQMVEKDILDAQVIAMTPTQIGRAHV